MISVGIIAGSYFHRALYQIYGVFGLVGIDKIPRYNYDVGFFGFYGVEQLFLFFAENVVVKIGELYYS